MATVNITPLPIETGGVALDRPKLGVTSDSGRRGMSSEQVTELKGPSVKLAYFVEAEFQSGTLRLWTGIGDSPLIMGQTWLGAGLFLGFTQIDEGLNVKATGISISLSGADQSLIAAALVEQYQGRPCSLYLGLFDANNVLIGEPFKFFTGQIDLIEIDPKTDGTATYTMKVENRMVDLMVVRPSYYTDQDQQARYPGDTFFKRVSQNTERKIVWGPGG